MPTTPPLITRSMVESGNWLRKERASAPRAAGPGHSSALLYVGLHELLHPH